MRRQERLFETEDLHVTLHRLTVDGVEQAATITRELFAHADKVTFEDIARSYLELPERLSIDEMRDLVSQIEAITNSRGDIADVLSDIGLVPIASDGRPAFGAGRNTPVGFSASLELKNAAGHLQAKTGMAKVIKRIDALYQTGQLSADAHTITLQTLASVGVMLQPAEIESAEEVAGVAA